MIELFVVRGTCKYVAGLWNNHARPKSMRERVGETPST
jgi:hypothetical protein